MLLIRRGWNHSVLVWKHLIWTRDDQCHTSHSLEPQSQAPASFAGKEWGCHHLRAEYSFQLETWENTCEHMSLVQAAGGCKGGTLGARVGDRVSPAHQHVPSPPSLTLGLHLHLLWEREWLEMAAGCLTRIIPVGCFPTAWKTPVVVGQIQPTLPSSQCPSQALRIKRLQDTRNKISNGIPVIFAFLCSS